MRHNAESKRSRENNLPDKRFAPTGLDQTVAALPEGTTLLEASRLPQTDNLTKRISTDINALLATVGLTDQKGSVVEATIQANSKLVDYSSVASNSQMKIADEINRQVVTHVK